MKLLLGAFALVAAVAHVAYELLHSNRRGVLLLTVGFVAGWLA